MKSNERAEAEVCEVAESYLGVIEIKIRKGLGQRGARRRGAGRESETESYTFSTAAGASAGRGKTLPIQGVSLCGGIPVCVVPLPS